MKEIIAYIQPIMLERVTDALRVQKIHGVTVLQCHGFGHRIDGQTPHYEDPAVELGYAPKAKLEIVCRDEEVPAIVQTIRETAHTGRHGDGKIFITEVTQAFDVRTSAEGEAIL